jgi:urocanate hydratase
MGEVINGGFGMVLDGSEALRRYNPCFWDVNNGISRRSWACNEGAFLQLKEEAEPIKVTIPTIVADNLLDF